MNIEKRHGVDLYKDDKLVCNLNDPSDVVDWLINFQGLPNELFLKELPNFGPSWEDLPIKFFWNCHEYVIKKPIKIVAS